MSDIRDSNTYVVRKLADGNCWMVQNLNLNLSTSVTLDSTTSDLTEGRTWIPENNTQTVEGITWSSFDVAHSFEPGENIYFTNGVGTGTLDPTTHNYSGYNTSGEPWYRIGNYYNWYAATAGTGVYEIDAEETVPDSICPKNWRLPNNTGEQSSLTLTTSYSLVDNDADSVNKSMRAPLNFVASGRYNFSEKAVWYIGYTGNWWSNTAFSSYYAYYHALVPDLQRSIPQNNGNKRWGLSIRCVAR